MREQNQVAENTAARGYRDGWTAEQFAARQVCKMVEELDELDACFGSYGHGWRYDLEISAQNARDKFDSDVWDDVEIWQVKKAQQELADLQVVIFNRAAALGEIAGEPFDVVHAAVAKSAADVERGVRE